MNSIINFVGKWSGISRVLGIVNGYKTKIGAVSLMLSGLAELTQKVVNLTDFASIISFAKTLPMDPGWVAISAGIAAWGLAHKIDKSAPEPK